MARPLGGRYRRARMHLSRSFFRLSPLLIGCLFLTACGSEGSVLEGEGNGHEGGEAAGAERSQAADPAFLEIYAATSGFRSGRPTGFQTAPDGSEILFLRSGPRDDQRSLFAVDPSTGTESEILTSAQLLSGTEEELSSEERALRERMRLTARGITHFELSHDGRLLLVPLSGKLFVVERNRAERGAIRELPSDGGYANDPQLSPDGKYVATIRNRELWLIDIARGTQRQLTRDASETVSNGLAEFVAQEEMSRYHGYWWSPDSKTILYQQNDESEVETLYASNPIDPAAEPHASPYPRAGTTNAKVRLGLLDVRSGRTRWVTWDNERFPYLAQVVWQRGAPLTLLVQDRAQQREQLLTVEPSTGTASLLHEERDEAWLNLDHSVPRWIVSEAGNRFLWSTERSGAWQLELRDESGDLLQTVTAPELGYAETLHVEPNGKAVWVAASDDPTERHLYRIPLAVDASAASHISSGEAARNPASNGDAPARAARPSEPQSDSTKPVPTPQRITTAPGWHDASFSTAGARPNGANPSGATATASMSADGAATPNTAEGPLWVHAADRQEDGLHFALRRGVETVVGSLRDAAEEPPFTPDVQYATVGARDYRTVVIRPRDFQRGQRYPVLLSVYAGPGYAKVRKGRDRYLREQWQADHGYLVVSIDGRGTPGRGREWERAIRGDVITVPLADQVEALGALAATMPEMDLSRVGVYGWSFGGYFSAHAVMQRPDVFKVAVAGAPVGDWRDYDTHYTERFMGLPDENRDGYARASVLTYADRLQRPLMIIHGTSDDNVYFVHALKMSDALLRADKPHELVVLAGSTHMVADPAVARALQQRIMGFLAGGLSRPCPPRAEPRYSDEVEQLERNLSLHVQVSRSVDCAESSGSQDTL